VGSEMCIRDRLNMALEIIDLPIQNCDCMFTRG
jgi:hypothetical protein